MHLVAGDGRSSTKAALLEKIPAGARRRYRNTKVLLLENENVASARRRHPSAEGALLENESLPKLLQISWFCMIAEGFRCILYL